MYHIVGCFLGAYLPEFHEWTENFFSAAVLNLVVCHYCRIWHGYNEAIMSKSISLMSV